MMINELKDDENFSNVVRLELDKLV